MTSYSTISQLRPEIILVVTAILTMVGGAFWPSRSAWSFLSTVGILLATLVTGMDSNQLNASPPDSMVTAAILFDPLGRFFRWIALLSGFFFLLISSQRTSEQRTGDTPGLILVLVSGLSLVGLAANGVVLFLALELISIPTYVLLFTGRSARSTAEGTLKYFLLSVLSSCLFLMGLAIVFGIVGSLDFATISLRLEEAASIHPRAILIAFMLLFSGIGFKLAAFPFHFYAPDVYQGVTNNSAGVLAVAPKIAGIVTLVRILDLGFRGNSDIGWQVLVMISILTMTIGNVSALWQRNLRRILAYSSIAHAGYLLIGIAAAMAGREVRGESQFDGISASLLYLVVYCVASLGIFAVLAELSNSNREASTLDDILGVSRHRPWLAGAGAICLFSLSGIPPFAGFWGKLGLLTAAINTAQGAESPAVAKWFALLAIAAVLNAATAAAYYLRMIAAMYFYQSETGATGMDRAMRTGAQPVVGAGAFASLTASAVVIALGILPGPLWTHVANLGNETLRTLAKSNVTTTAMRP